MLTDYHSVPSTALDDFVLESVSIINPDGRNQDVGFNFIFYLYLRLKRTTHGKFLFAFISLGRSALRSSTS